MQDVVVAVIGSGSGLAAGGAPRTACTTTICVFQHGRSKNRQILVSRIDIYTNEGRILLFSILLINVSTRWCKITSPNS
jgi:hypothetical protein